MSDVITRGLRQPLLLILMLMVCLAGLSVPVQAAENQSVGIQNPASDLWREVRQRQGQLVGNTQMKGVDAGVLINTDGAKWRDFRMQKLVPYSLTLLGLAIIGLASFRLVRGKLTVANGMSGVKIPRFTRTQRMLHWIVAILFILLAITGTLLTFGRAGLVPIIGNEAFGGLAYAAKRFHDFAGPFFGLALVAMVLSFLKDNIPNDVDVKWFLKLGGFFGEHASSERYNAGEKAWYWIVFFIGAAVVVSGLILDFPNYGQSRELMSNAHMVHSVSAILILAASLGHIYMGTIGTEGSLETMTTGYCDENWAKEHHDLWYEEMKKAGKVGAVMKE